MIPTPSSDSYTRITKLNRLVEVSLVLNSTLELQPLLRNIMDAAAEITHAESASILLLDPKTQELYFMAFTNSDTDAEHTQTLMEIPVPLTGSVAGTVIKEERVIAIDDISAYPAHYRKADDESGFQTQSLLAIPMYVREDIIGVLEAVNKLEGQGWTQDDIQFLEILASQAGVALENARLVQKLREAYDELSQLDKMKNDFIAIASHELRTPLGVILGYASFLQEEAEGEASEHATAVLNSALKMRQIIEDMTNLRFIKMGASEMSFEIISAAEVMHKAMMDAQIVSEAHGYRLKANLPPEEIKVRVDLGKMVMGLTNLLNNALKYSPKNGQIELGYRLQAEEIWLMVQDQGIGILPQHYDKIFEDFFQVEDHMTRRHNGMGLGLSIAKAIVEAHQGRIWVESMGLEMGSTFFISLPLPQEITS